jgi:hypothetical protein
MLGSQFLLFPISKDIPWAYDFKILVDLYNGYSSKVVHKMLMCTVIYFSDKINDQVSNVFLYSLIYMSAI